MPKPKRESRAHHLLHYMFRNSELNRHEIAKRIGITRKTLYEWEYQLTPYKKWMGKLAAEAANMPLSEIPDHILKRTEADEIRNYSTPTDKPKEEPRTPNNPNTARKQVERNAKGYEVELNYGKPTERNKNPWTFSDVTPQQRRIRDEGVKIPSDADYPDLISIALKGVGPYDALFVPKHSVPRCTSETGTISLPAGWYYKSASGQVHRRMTQDEATRHIEDLRQEDDLTASGLL